MEVEEVSLLFTAAMDNSPRRLVDTTLMSLPCHLLPPATKAQHGTLVPRAEVVDPHPVSAAVPSGRVSFSRAAEAAVETTTRTVDFRRRRAATTHRRPPTRSDCLRVHRAVVASLHSLPPDLHLLHPVLPVLRPSLASDSPRLGPRQRRAARARLS